MIELKEVSCSFSDGFGGKGLFTAVSPLSAHFSDGGRYAIVGESGSGKTTLARMIAGFRVCRWRTCLWAETSRERTFQEGADYSAELRICPGPQDPGGEIHRGTAALLFPHGERETAGTLPELDGALQSITGLLYPSSIRTVRRRTKAGGNRQGTGR